VPIVLKSVSLKLLEPSGPIQACNEIALPLPLPLLYVSYFYIPLCIIFLFLVLERGGNGGVGNEGWERRGGNRGVGNGGGWERRDGNGGVGTEGWERMGANGGVGTIRLSKLPTLKHATWHWPKRNNITSGLHAFLITFIDTG
jgi:hypothetical protein